VSCEVKAKSQKFLLSAAEMQPAPLFGVFSNVTLSVSRNTFRNVLCQVFVTFCFVFAGKAATKSRLLLIPLDEM
jgi:hypothetical protein